MIWNDIKKNKLMSFTIVMFMTVVACMFALTIQLSVYLLGSVQNLMSAAQTPDFLQMHAGELHLQELQDFAEQQKDVEHFQVSRFLNLYNGDVYLNGQSLIDNTQDNGLSTQNEKFDFLFDMNQQKPVVAKGQIYVPVCYMQQYELQPGMQMRIGAYTFEIAGFIRDAQMNSMMASSKRFLVCEEDYEAMQALGTEEYLIEFLLREQADTQAFATMYADAGLDANGPTITAPLIRMMNALSDGVMVMIFLAVSVAMLLIAIVCIRFSVLTKLEKDKREIATLKALGISQKDVNHLYFTKFLLFALMGLLIGLAVAFLLQGLFVKEMQELYGSYQANGMVVALSVAGAAFVLGVMLWSVWKTLKRTARLSVVEAMNGRGEAYKLSVRKQYVMIGLIIVACVSMALIPTNMASTFGAPEFATYMGIGDGEIRIDVNQTDHIFEKTEQIRELLSTDTRIEEYAVLQTQNFKMLSPEGEWTNLTVERGDHTIFPVRYSSGNAPREVDEIALSYLNASEMGINIGDTLTLFDSEKEVTYRVCGIYSDITNGGKSAKIAQNDTRNADEELMWSVIYVSPKSDVDMQSLISEYQMLLEEKALDASIIDVQSYIRATYGPTIVQIQRIARLVTCVAVLVIVVVLSLFVCLVIEKERYKISLHKALGFTTAELKLRYYRNYFICSVTAVVLGIILGNLVGEAGAGMFLHSLGANGFEFIMNPLDVYVKIPFIVMISAGVAVTVGLTELKTMKAYECCLRREA